MRLAFTNFSIKSPTGKKSGRFFLALFLGIFLFLAHPILCQAGFASSTPFTGASWELVGEYPILGSNGAVQSVCATEDYIICIENFNDLTTEPDAKFRAFSSIEIEKTEGMHYNRPNKPTNTV